MKVAFVTGAAGGLGSALALELGPRGFHVVAVCRADGPGKEALEERMRTARVGGQVLVQDITASDVTERFERLDCVCDATTLLLVHNACAPFQPKPFHLQTWDEVASGLDVAVKGGFQCTRALLRPLVRCKGMVANVLSRAVAEPPKGFSSYVIAKTALLGMTRALAAEYAGRLRVLSLSPGFMDTPLTAGWDERLRDAARGAGAKSAEAVARDAVDVLLAPGTAGKGEDYPL